MLKSEDEKLGYAIGVAMGKNIANFSNTIDHPALFKGIRDGIAGVHPMMSEEEMHSYISSFDQIMSVKQVAENNKKAGEQFLTENAQKPGVISMPSGLQYKVMQMGQGKSPKITDTVTAHYRGFFIDGREFANSYQTGAPQTFALKAVIKGWAEALQLMKVGDIWHVYIPWELAYGKEGYAGVIPPHSTLVFQIELIAIN